MPSGRAVFVKHRVERGRIEEPLKRDTLAQQKLPSQSLAPTVKVLR